MAGVGAFKELQKLFILQGGRIFFLLSSAATGSAFRYAATSSAF